MLTACRACQVHKELSNSNREGIDEKLKYKQKPYKMKVLKKVTNYVFWVHKDLSYSYREGISKKLKYKQKPYKMKGWKKYTKFTFFENIFHNSDVLQSNPDKKNPSALTFRDLSN